MIKVWEYKEQEWGYAFKRISKALRDFSPDDIQWVESPFNADIILLNIVGDIPRWLLEMKNKVFLQHVYFTMHRTADTNWVEEWKRALLTVSFHPLNEYHNEEFNFLHTPWGADERTFVLRDPPFARDFKVITTGHVAFTENIDKLYLACKQLGTFMIHTGHNFGYDSQYYKYLNYMKDTDLVDILNSTQYTSCLREHEGFEMLGVEGLFCGARPIVFDLPTYQWYKGHGIFIKQDEHVVDSLVEVLSQPPKEISSEEYLEIVNKFSWDRIVKNIFKRIKEEYNG